MLSNVCRKHLKPIYEPGDIIISEMPFAYMLHGIASGLYCDNCFTRGVKAGFPGGSELVACSGCGYDHYCSPSCREAASAIHRFECHLLKYATNTRVYEQPLDVMRLIHRTLLRRRAEEEMGQAALPEKSKWARYGDLLSHETEWMKTDELFASTLEYAPTYFSQDGRCTFDWPTASEIRECFGKVRVNGFEICYDDLNPIGEAVYLDAASFNHSCAANAVQSTTDGKRLNIRALRRIDTSLEEVHINYRKQWLATRSERQEYLSSNYFFVCQCPLCCHSDPANAQDERLHSMRCLHGDECRKLQCCESGCAMNGDDFGSEEARKSAEQQSSEVLAQLADAEEHKDFERAVEIATSYLTAAPALNVCHISVIRVREKLVKACFDLNDFREAGVDAAEVLLDLYRLFYQPPTNVLVGVLQFRLGVMLERGCRYESASKHLKEALQMLTVTHGCDHVFVKNVAYHYEKCQSAQSANGGQPQ